MEVQMFMQLKPAPLFFSTFQDYQNTKVFLQDYFTSD